MQLANILLALGGNEGTSTISKFGVTPSEVAVLRILHGDEAVTEIEVVGEIVRSSKDELARLNDIYTRRGPDGRPVPNGPVAGLFPGAAAPVFQNFDELDIPEDFYKAETRKTARTPAPVAVKAADPLDHDGDGKKGGSKPKTKAETGRQRGEPAPGKKKRTKAEIAADEDADLADAEAAAEAADVEDDEDDGIRPMDDADIMK